ncbi:MAG TPA: M3 family metallopeptidase [Thermoanaerobaculia bacterium]
MKRLTLLAATALLVACQTTTPTAPATTPASASANPFFAKSTLPYQTPPFDTIRDEHYMPAFEEGMKQQNAEIAAIANSPTAPTFANTIEALERSGELLLRTGKVFFNLSGANTNDAMQKIEADISPRLSAHSDAIYMNAKLYARVKSLYDQRDMLNLAPEPRRLLERTYRAFQRAGATLNDADQATLRKLNEEESSLNTKFREKLLADTDASAIVVDDKAMLAGFTDAQIAAAAERAKERKLDGKYVITLQNTTGQPSLASLENRELRRRIMAASEARGSHGGENDTTAIAQRLAQLRAQKAKLLGYPTYAAYVLDDQGAKTPENAFKLMTDLVPGATAKAREEVAKIQSVIDKQNGGFALTAADWDFYAEQVRKAEYDLDESEVMPYFELDRVLNDGVFYAANQLYGITFKPRTDLPVYHPDVRVWEVFNADGTPLALYYGDFYSRSNKGGGAWMEAYVDQSQLLGTKPVIYNVTNFAKPAPGEKALLSFDDISTLFHEFGHALHGMFSNVRYRSLSGVNVPNDFGEFPSQVNEHWALEPKVFANFAKHYQTGAPMPQELVEKIRKSRTFNQGYATTEYLAAALVDMAWHTLPVEAPLQNTGDFEKAALERYRIAVPQVPPRYHTPYFAHIWGGGYAAAYYAYLWSEVIGHDAFYWFKENGGLTRANGQRFRDMVLSRGGSMDAATMYRAFRGRDPIVEPLLIERGLK